MPRVTQLVMGSTARPWVIQDRMRVKPQSDHTESASELAALSVSCPVRQGLTPRSRNLRAPRPSPNGRAFYSEPPGQLLGSVPARAQPQARAGLSVHVFCHRAAWVPREVGAAVVPVWRWDREAPRDLVPWLRSPLSAGAGVGIYFLTSGLAS